MHLTNIIKPTHICNLKCRYCYNEDARRPIMNIVTLERVISETFNYCAKFPKPSVASFVWHGGEPMVAKIEFYERVIGFQERHNQGVRYQNAIQTNGTLFNQGWIDFFKQNAFNISISIDGPRSLNDENRIYSNGKGSFDKVMEGIRMVKEAGLALGVSVVINKQNKDYIDEVYDFLVREKLNFNIIPLTRGGDAINCYNDVGLEAEEYAEPWIKMFDRWFYEKDENFVYCSDFISKTGAIVAGEPNDCIGQKVCARHNISIDPDGYVYPCATLSADSEWNYGNIHEKDLAELLESEPALKAINRKRDPHCQKCKWEHVCYGGCLSRAIKFYDTVGTRDYYCPSLYKIYEHIEKRLREEKNVDLGKLPSEKKSGSSQKPVREREVVKKTFQRPVVKKKLSEIINNSISSQGCK